MKSRMPAFACIIIFLLTLSCKKEVNRIDQEPEQEQPKPIDKGKNILAENVVVIDPTIEITISENGMSIPKSVFKRLPEHGDILLGTPTASNPYGFMQKIIALQIRGDQYVCETTQASLNETFESLDIDTAFFTGNESVALMSATAKGMEAFASPAADGFSVDFELEKIEEIVKGVKLEGKLKINFSGFKFKYLKKKGSVLPETFYFEVDMDTRGSSITMDFPNPLGVLEEVEPTEIGSITLPAFSIVAPVPTPIGIIPMLVPMVHKVGVRVLGISINGKVQLDVTPIIDAKLGFKYINESFINVTKYTDEFTNLSDFCSKDFAFKSYVRASVNLIEPFYELAPYGIDALKFFVEMPNRLDLSISTDSPNYTLKYQGEVAGGVRTKLWTGLEREVVVRASIPNKVIASGNFTYCDVCADYDVAGWWSGLDATAQTAFNKVIGKSGTTLPDRDGLAKLFSQTQLWQTAYDRPPLRGKLTIPKCFANLQYLDIIDTQLEQLVLDDLPNLEGLYCHGNQLNRLVINDAPSLRGLSCGGNRLSVIEIASPLGLPVLARLDCNSNKIKSLNLEAMPRLTDLNIADNLFTTFPAYKLTEYTRFFCGGNQIPSLDLSYASKLKILNCDGGKFNELDVSRAINLERLHCSNNNLTSLNVDGLTKLLTLECENNKLKTLQGSGLSALYEIKPRYNPLGDEGMRRLIAALPANVKWYFGTCEDYGIDSRAGDGICSAVNSLYSAKFL